MSWLDFYKSFSIVKDAKVKKQKKEDTCDKCEPEVVTEAKYEQFCDEHIIEEPAVVLTPEDAVVAASITDDEFHSVLGELPDCKPCVRPEDDAVLTKEEEEAVEVKVKVRRTPAKTDKTAKSDKPATKSKRGRPKKNA